MKMKPELRKLGVLGALAICFGLAPGKAEDQDARKLFGAATKPSSQPLSPIGSYANGCLCGAKRMPLDGPHWQVMRPSRNRFWAHKDLIQYIEELSERAHKDGWNGILIGDLSQPRGGPMVSGHASHQIGLDADLWLTPMPNRKLSEDERESMEAHSVLVIDSANLDPKIWTEAHANFVRDAAQDDRVARIFVTPAIKLALAQKKDPDGKDTWWLRKLRPYEGHDDHIHVRLHCPEGARDCIEQEPPPEGDGCGAELDEGMKKTAADPPYTSHPQPETPPDPFPLSKLPRGCVDALK